MGSQNSHQQHLTHLTFQVAKWCSQLECWFSWCCLVLTIAALTTIKGEGGCRCNLQLETAPNIEIIDQGPQGFCSLVQCLECHRSATEVVLQKATCPASGNWVWTKRSVVDCFLVNAESNDVLKIPKRFLGIDSLYVLGVLTCYDTLR